MYTHKTFCLFIIYIHFRLFRQAQGSFDVIHYILSYLHQLDGCAGKTKGSCVVGAIT